RLQATERRRMPGSTSRRFRNFLRAHRKRACRSLSARAPAEEEEAQPVATGVIEGRASISAPVTDPTSRGRAVQVARFRIPAPAAALGLSPLRLRHPLSGRFFADSPP